MEQAIGTLGGEAKRFEMVTGDAERHLELIMANAASRAGQLTGAFAREAERLKETSANPPIRVLTQSDRHACATPAPARKLSIGESAAQAKHDARSLVGEAMAECERLLRAAGEMSAEATQIRSLLASTIEEVERHLARLPTVAQGEAQRIRQMVQAETDQMLDLSARTLSTIHARNAQGRGVPPPPQAAAVPVPEAPEPEGLKGLARKLTQRPKRDADIRGKGEAKGWEMKTLLAAAENSEGARTFPAAPRRWARCKWRWPTWRWTWKRSAWKPSPAMRNGNVIWPATAPCSRASWRMPSTMPPSTASPRSIARMRVSMTRRMPI